MTKAPNLLKDVQKIELDLTKRYILFIPSHSGTNEQDKGMLENVRIALENNGLQRFSVVSLPNIPDIQIIEIPQP